MKINGFILKYRTVYLVYDKQYFVFIPISSMYFVMDLGLLSLLRFLFLVKKNENKMSFHTQLNLPFRNSCSYN